MPRGQLRDTYADSTSNLGSRHTYDANGGGLDESPVKHTTGGHISQASGNQRTTTNDELQDHRGDLPSDGVTTSTPFSSQPTTTRVKRSTTGYRLPRTLLIGESSKTASSTIPLTSLPQHQREDITIPIQTQLCNEVGVSFFVKFRATCAAAHVQARRTYCI